MRRWWTVISMVVALTTSSHAWAQSEELEELEELDSRLYVMLGVEAWFLPDAGGHGAALVAWQKDDVWNAGDLDLRFNTDTLQATVRNVRLTDRVVLGGRLKGQALFGGLLRDYYREGRADASRGFWASYLNAAPHVEIQDAPHYVQFELGVRKWLFNAADPDTSPALDLPPDLWSFEARLRYTLWNADHDPSFSDPHRTSWRFNGWAAGLELAADLRSDTSAWGALAPDGFAPVDRRNTSTGHPLWLRAWARGGRPLWSGGRTQGMLFASWGQNEDDLTRMRVGGMNPYVIPVHGLPWASHVLGNFVSGHGKLMQEVLADSEIGLAVDVVGLSSEAAARTSRSRNLELEQALVGLGAVGDFRFDDWQLDVRVGLAPRTEALAEGPHVSAWVAVGKQIF